MLYMAKSERSRAMTATKSNLEELNGTCRAEAIRLAFPELVSKLQDLLTARLVAYIGSVGETRAVRQWAEGSRKPQGDVARRLRETYALALCISREEDIEATQAWFQGLNPLLDDAAPARLLREGDLDKVGPMVIRAERHFLAEG